MEFRKLKKNDLSALVHFAQKIERGPQFNWDKESLISGLDTWEIWAGFQGLQICVALAGLASGEQMELLWIQSLRESRRKGLARKLMLDWIDAARRKYSQVILEVHAQNLSAQNLYRSLGFEHINTRKKYYSDGSDAYIFSLNLSN